MATASIAPIADSSSGGLKSVQDLYALINGQTTKTSGGTQTTTESSGITKESMDALLKSALEGTTGLAAIASGQRAAGGYNSSANTLLTNDFLTRTAAQIAQSNKTTTRTTVTAPQKTTVGGITPKGVGKTAGFLGALQALDKLGFRNLFSGAGTRKEEGNGFPSESAGSSAAAATAENLAAYNNPAYSGSLASAVEAPVATAAPSSFDLSQLNNLDFYQLDDTSGGSSATPLIDPSVDTVSSDDVASVPDLPPGGGDVVEEIYIPFLPPPQLDDFADGGEVKRRRRSLLNETQNSAGGFSSGGGGASAGSGGSSASSGGGSSSASVSNFSATSAPLSLSSGPVGSNGNDGGPATERFSSPATRSSDGSINGSYVGTSEGNAAAANARADRTGQDPLDALMGVTNAFGTGTGGGSGGFGSILDASGITRGDIQSLSRGAGAIASLAGNADLGNLATIGSIASSNNPALSLGLTAAGRATGLPVGGLYGLATSNEGTIKGNLVDFALALNPISSAANAISRIANGSSLGGYVNTAANIAASPRSAALGEIANEVAIKSENTPTGDPLEAFLGITNAFGTGTSPTTQAPAEVSDLASSAAGNPDAGYYGSDVNTPAADPGQTGIGPGIGGVGDGLGAGVGGATGGGFQADGGLITGPGTGVSDSIKKTVKAGSYILPADVTRMVGTDYVSKWMSKNSAEYADGGSAGGTGKRVPVNVSAGELEIPPEMVEAIGADKLDKLIEKFHVPAALQRLGAGSAGLADGGRVKAKRTAVQEANDRGEIPERVSSDGENIFERRNMAIEAMIRAGSAGEDTQSTYRRRMGLRGN